MIKHKKSATKLQPPATLERFVFDACVLIAFFNDEAGAEKVEKLIKQAEAGKIEIFIMAINVYEVYYDALRRSAKENAEKLLDDIESLPLTIIETIDRKIIHSAGYFKTTYKMSLADSFALGFAKQLDAKVASADHHEFYPVEKAGDLQFYWIR